MTIRLVRNDLRSLSLDQEDCCNEQHDKCNSCKDDDWQEARIALAFFRRWIVSSRLNLRFFRDGRCLGRFNRIRHTPLDARGVRGVVWLLLFVTTGAGHQLANCIRGALVAMEDGIDLLRDGHLDAIACREAECSGG